MSKKTLVLGASPKVERYSNKATKLLLEKGHEVSLFGNRVSNIYENPIISDWDLLDKENIDTVTMYIGARHQDLFYDKIIALNPERVIFNPGTENDVFYSILKEKNIAYEEACTLVLLNLSVF